MATLAHTLLTRTSGTTSTTTLHDLTTDHLGTPIAVTDPAGTLLWTGGFEPFGRDWQAPASTGADTVNLFLRLPGRWQDKTRQDTLLGDGLAYNVQRWYELETGRYTRVDPLPLKPSPLLFVHGASSPTFYSNRFGLAPVHNSSQYPVPYKPEHGEQFELCLPGEDCDVDGVYPPTCSDFPVKIVSGCNGDIGEDGKLRVYCPFFDPEAPGLKRKFPRLGQMIIGGRTNADFHDGHRDWPVPNGKPFCGCEPPAGSQQPP